MNEIQRTTAVEQDNQIDQTVPYKEWHWRDWKAEYGPVQFGAALYLIIAFGCDGCGWDVVAEESAEEIETRFREVATGIVKRLQEETETEK